MKFIQLTSRVLSAAAIATVFGLGSTAIGHSSYLTAWRNAYPTSTLPARMTTTLGSACYVCHHPTDTANAGNCYKNALVVRLNAGRTIAQAIADVENLDSDNDGVSNRDEILRPRAGSPNEIGYNPGLSGATGVDPCSPTPTVPVTNVAETPPPACRADFNRDGTVTSQDFFDFLAAFFGQSAAADVNHDGAVTSQDFFDFLSAFFAGC